MIRPTAPHERGPGETSCAGRSDRCLFSSVLALGALFGLMASPCARSTGTSMLIILGVPVLTFVIAAPSRLSLWRELGLFLRDAQASLLAGVLLAVGRKKTAFDVVRAHHHGVEAAYARAPRLSVLVAQDPLRLHHARRLGGFAALLAVTAGVGLPFIRPETFTFGPPLVAPFVFLFDVLVIGVVARVVAERMAVRLFEASVVLSANTDGSAPWLGRLRALPLTTMLGTAIGAVGGLVVLTAAALASGIETAVLGGPDIATSAGWFMRSTIPDALPLGIAAGAILGAGLGFAQSRRA